MEEVRCDGDVATQAASGRELYYAESAVDVAGGASA